MLYRIRRVAWVLPVLGFVFLSSVPAGDEFPSRNVELMGQLRMRTFGSGSDCWGYTSPSGREYALVGFNRGVVVAEVTAPTKPRVVQTFVGVSSVWRDIKVYRDHAYVSNEERGGLLIFDLSEIDRGLIATSETLEGGHTSHNLAVDEVSGFLYRLANTRPQDGMNVFDVSTPGEPQLVGSWHDRYIHDAQVVTYTSGKFQGRQIAFCAANRTPGGGSPRLDVLDVTDKSDIRRIDSVQYDGSVFAHQVWLTEDRRYLYLNDELDEIERRTRTRGFIFDVEDVDNPRYLRSFTNGSRAVDHNMYVDGDLLFAANYRSGLRLFDISTPTEPQEIGFFDTYPPNDNADIGGLWSAYPFLPSGTVIGSDRDEGILLFWAGLDEDEDG
ncbi:MAG: choice-of-anchor B family protein, partial [Planctomycetota bacterium]